MPVHSPPLTPNSLSGIGRPRTCASASRLSIPCWRPGTRSSKTSAIGAIVGAYLMHPPNHDTMTPVPTTWCDAMSDHLDDPMETALAWRLAGHSVVLATVVKTWGSAPRQSGAQMCINDEGSIAGSVSGGCVEGAVIHEAEAILSGGGVKFLSFGVSNEEAWEVGLACGGTVEVFLERIE